ncbi:hypothetical protein FDP41_012827 [Naegleria fowleri]|uniref:DOMON domain-containing protein n=1 Tax=Naegleria fowleri TaxID=5763 RepID=A0A6A5C6W6_NAEFO|nr:uncharacterized protein FDP41_012827 [Naegleria fowleri]KAF0981039.1 hypothetical protein FDP41_012827 [Naegleria fowleri]
MIKFYFFLLLFVLFSFHQFLTVKAQNNSLPTTFENCYAFRSKSSSDIYKVEWTLDELNDRLSVKFTLPSAPGYGAVGFKNPNQGFGMSGSTVLLGYGNGIVNEYFASGNTQPNKLTNNQFIVASSSTIGNVTTLTYVRTLSRPNGAPNTYFAFTKNNSVTLLFASSLKVPASPTSFLQHYRADLYSGGLDFYMKNVNTCIPITSGVTMRMDGWDGLRMNGLHSMVMLCLTIFSIMVW